MHAIFFFKRGIYLVASLVLIASVVFAQEPPPDEFDDDGTYPEEMDCGPAIVIKCPGVFSTPCAGTKSGWVCTACCSKKCSNCSDRNSYCTTTVIGTTGHFHCFGGYKKTGGGICSN